MYVRLNPKQTVCSFASGHAYVLFLVIIALQAHTVYVQSPLFLIVHYFVFFYSTVEINWKLTMEDFLQTKSYYDIWLSVTKKVGLLIFITNVPS